MIRARTLPSLGRRSWLSLGAALGLAGPLVRPGGYAFLWKGQRLEEELTADPGWRDLWEEGGIVDVGGDGAKVAIFKLVNKLRATQGSVSRET